MGWRFWKVGGMVLCAATLALGCTKPMVQKKDHGDPLLNTATSTNTSRKPIVGASAGGGSADAVVSYPRPEWSPPPVPPTRRDSTADARKP
jgi:hypothetical protein